ncbi:hypothetical protein Q0590_32235 [Rhodocytophaga aerolata]|uniref:Uncharacterized protein n=1 Tax=Rhodocytophaga aerolata TaxID=455078 RepID=A0ABT8RIJ0_9BACT|nr:hypothetical protein [Rhodocytophaga aerolata]MDO1450988.1 hypothetical protein [Rhodocytophaga aerolata]
MVPNKKIRCESSSINDFSLQERRRKYVSGAPEFSSHKLPSNTKLNFEPVADGKVQVNVGQFSNNKVHYQRADVMERSDNQTAKTVSTK